MIDLEIPISEYLFKISIIFYFNWQSSHLFSIFEHNSWLNINKIFMNFFINTKLSFKCIVINLRIVFPFCLVCTILIDMAYDIVHFIRIFYKIIEHYIHIIEFWAICQILKLTHNLKVLMISCILFHECCTGMAYNDKKCIFLYFIFVLFCENWLSETCHSYKTNKSLPRFNLHNFIDFNQIWVQS